MLKLFTLTAAGLALGALGQAQAQTQVAAKPVYMQIFYEGSQWLSGRQVLSYSPAFRGKQEELVHEPDSIRNISPNAWLMGPKEPTTTVAYATVATEKGTFIPDSQGRMHLETAADRQRAHQQEQAQLNRGLNLLEARASLGRAALAKALNECANDGWEVVQMTSWGSKDGLVYLLRRR